MIEQLRSGKKASARKLKRKTGYETSEDEEELGGNLKRLRLESNSGDDQEMN